MHKIRLCRTPLRYAIELSPRLWSDPREQSEWGRNFEHGSPVCCCTLYVVVFRRSGPPNLFRGWSLRSASLCAPRRVCPVAPNDEQIGEVGKVLADRRDLRRCT